MLKTAEFVGQQLIDAPEAAGAVAVDTALATQGEAATTPYQIPSAVDHWAGDFSDPDRFNAHVDHLVETMPTDYDTARRIAVAAMGEPRPDWMPAAPPRSAEETRAMLSNMGISPTKGRRRPLENMTHRRRLFR
jgi:hypothetical protein